MEVQEYYRAAIGEKNAEFYLARFQHFDSHGVVVSWNWPAFFFTFYWLLHRKMRFFALLYILLPLPLAVIDSIIFPADDIVVAVTSLLYLAATFIALPAYANALYYWQVRKMIDIAGEEGRDDETLRMINAGGGTNSISRTLTISLVLIVALLVIAVVMEMVLGSEI